MEYTTVKNLSNLELMDPKMDWNRASNRQLGTSARPKNWQARQTPLMFDNVKIHWL